MASSGRPIETARLLLRPPEAGDEGAYLALFRQPGVEAWLRPPPLAPFTEAELAQMLRDDVDHWRQTGFGPWAMIETESGAYVGRAGLRWTAIAGEAAVELAWTVDPERQGRGLAAEAALAGLELGRELGIEEAWALVLPSNLASRRVAEKLAMALAGEVEHAGLPHLLFRKRL